MLTYDAPERNKGPILEILQRALPPGSHVLEIGSGTGQHVVHFAAALPRTSWQPSDREAQHREAILERTGAAGLANVAPPLDIDVTHRPWPVGALDAIVSINMIHIAPWDAGIALVEEAGRLLQRNGVLFLYGPYRRHGAHTAASNEAFDEGLRARNPAWGVRDLEAVQSLAEANGFVQMEVHAMPANNLSVVFRKIAPVL